jgi:uncharacterized coiled-coil protein SlyX
MARENDDVKGFVVSPARVGFVLSLVALATFGFRTVDYVKAQEFKIQSLETYVAEDKVQTKEILKELKTLNERMQELVFVVKGTSIAPTSPAVR